MPTGTDDDGRVADIGDDVLRIGRQRDAAQNLAVGE